MPLGKSINVNSTDGVLDFLENLTNRVQENFKEILGEDTDKKCFLK